MAHGNNYDQLFTECGAYWRHSGDLNEPFVRTSAGLITDGYFNGQKVMEDGLLFGLACQALWRMADGYGVTGNHLRVVGAEKGGITMSSRISEAGKCLGAYGEKVSAGAVWLHFEFHRFSFNQDERFLLVEDTVTSGTSVRLLEAAVRKRCDGWEPEFVPFVLALCNRSGYPKVEGRLILSLVSPAFKVWKEGENPYTPDGNEVVSPISEPKYGWTVLQQRR